MLKWDTLEECQKRSTPDLPTTALRWAVVEEKEASAKLAEVAGIREKIENLLLRMQEA